MSNVANKILLVQEYSTFGNMKNSKILLAIALFLIGCEKNCNEDFRLGEVLQIPLDLNNYQEADWPHFFVLKINKTDSLRSPLSDILWTGSFSDDNKITDSSPDGDYSSDLDGSSLHFYYYDTDGKEVLVDSMTNIVIRKSQEKVDDPCYADHPSVQIDELSYEHNGQTKGKGDIVVLRK